MVARMPNVPAVPCVGIQANTPAAVLVASLLCQIRILEAYAGTTFQELVNNTRRNQPWNA